MIQSVAETSVQRVSRAAQEPKSVTDVLYDLVIQMRAGSEPALRALYDATVGRLYVLAMAVLKNPDAAEEVLAATYADAWARAFSYDATRGPVFAWLLTMCRSRALDYLRKQRQRKCEIDIEGLDAVPDAALGPDELLNLLQRQGRVHAALAGLSELRRRLVTLAFLRGLSHEEIAQTTGMALGTVKSHVRRALLQLRAELANV